MRAVLLSLSLLLVTANLMADEAKKPCSDEVRRQFDFWVGEWNVIADGKKAGENSITAIHGGCALKEEWRGASGFTGTSLNAFDASAGKWMQTWVDSSGLVLQIQGGIVQPGVMQMTGKRRDAEGNEISERITWTKNEKGGLRQVWDQSKNGGKWETVFDGTYHRK